MSFVEKSGRAPLWGRNRPLVARSGGGLQCTGEWLRVADSPFLVVTTGGSLAKTKKALTRSQDEPPLPHKHTHRLESARYLKKRRDRIVFC